MSGSFHRLAALAAFAAATALATAASADKYLFSGTHSIKFSLNGVMREVSKSGTGVAIVNRKAADTKLNTLEIMRPFAEINEIVMGDELGTMGTTPLTELEELQFNGVKIDVDRVGLKGLAKGPPSGKFGPIYGAAKGGMLSQSTLPAAGTIRLCVFAGCMSGGTLMVDLVQKDTTTTGPDTMTYAIGPGVGGKFQATGMTGTKVDVTGNPWTVKTAKADWVKNGVGTTTLSSKGFVCGPQGLTGMGAACANNANGTTLASGGVGGMVQLVTPIQTTCVGACGSANSPAAQISRLTLTFAPEPRLLVLLGAGAAALALLARTRARH
jgi:hypothetical protein